MLLTLLTAVLLAQAAPRDGVAVAGVVQDQTGAVLPGASVTLSIAGPAAPVQTSTTDQSGAFRFDHVAVGEYDIRTEFLGFVPKSTHVRVGSRAPGPVTIVLAIEGVTQEISVSGSSTETSTSAESNLNAITVSGDQLDDLPVLDQDVVGAMSRFLDSTAIGTNGATVLVNGIEVNALALSASAIQQIRINQDPYSAEFMRPGRGRIEIITKPGGKEYSGTFNVRFRDSAFAARNAFASVKPPEQRRIVEGTLGGAIGDGTHTSFLASGFYDAQDNQSIVYAQTPDGTLNTNVATPFRNLLAAGSVTHQFGENNTGSFRFSHLYQRTTNQGVGGTTLPEAGFNHTDREDEATYTHQTILSRQLFHETRFLYGQEYEPRASINPAPKIVVQDSFVGGGAQNDQVRTEHHFTLVDALTWSPGRQTVKFGINIPDWSWRGNTDATNVGGTFSFSSLATYQLGRPYAYVAQRGDGQTLFLEKVVGLFVRDEVRLRPNLTIDLGLRYDWQNYFHDDDNVAPRLSFAYSPDAARRTVLRGGAGIFYDRTGPGPIQDLLRYDGEHLMRYVLTDPGFPNPIPPGESLAAQPASLVRLAPDVTIPYLLDYGVGLERQLRPKTTLAINLHGSRGYDQFRSRDVNAPPPPDYDARPDPTYSVVRQIESAGTAKSINLEVTLRGQATAHFNGTAQYSVGRASNDTSGINWMPPNMYDLSREYGPSDFDRTQVVELFGTVTAGAWMNLGVAFESYSGRPYSLITGLDLYNTGTANARPAGVGRNTLRGPAYASLDLRWSHEFPFGAAAGQPRSKRALTAGVDAFNVTNRVNDNTPVGNLSSPFFGQPISAQAARRIQFSLRVRY
ncbi:MAG TPA: carboxypeptidase regulatory-like domain-containing protein [Vicinamibacterales bacterium]|nr:carboxypeptidase regulatory-like domain-containing protein [Vicinamibacterales bacterium]